MELREPFRAVSFRLASEDWLREFDEMLHEMEHVLKKPDLLTTSKCDSDLLYTSEQVMGLTKFQKMYMSQFMAGL